jgi:hypothetical protein
VADDAISEALGAKKAFAGEVNPDEFVNVSKFALDPSGEARLRGEVDRVVREKGLAPKQKITWEETKALASSMGLDKIDGKVGRLDGPKMLAIRNIVSQNVEALDGLYKKVNGGGIDVGERGAVDGQIAVLEKQNDALLSRFVKARSQTGRDLNNLKILANRTMDPVIWRTKAENLVKQGGKVLSPEQRMTIDRLTNTGDRQGLVKYIASLRPTSVGEKLTTVWKAGLLTAPPTHLANIMGNVGMAALETAKDLPASIVDRVLSVATKQRTKSFSVARTARATLTAAKDRSQGSGLHAKGVQRWMTRSGEVGQFPTSTDVRQPDRSTATRRASSGRWKPRTGFFKSIAYQRSLSEQLALNGGKMTDEIALQAVHDGRGRHLPGPRGAVRARSRGEVADQEVPQGGGRSRSDRPVHPYPRQRGQPGGGVFPARLPQVRKRHGEHGPGLGSWPRPRCAHSRRPHPKPQAEPPRVPRRSSPATTSPSMG